MSDETKDEPVTLDTAHLPIYGMDTARAHAVAAEAVIQNGGNERQLMRAVIHASLANFYALETIAFNSETNAN